jgi:hypothetical protein
VKHSMRMDTWDMMLWKTHNRGCMATALVYCGTPEGFIIGADGRAFNRLKQQIESDTERKIFAFENQAATVAFAWAGIVKAQAPDFVFSLVDETHDLLPQLDFNGFFAQELNAKLKRRLRMLRTNDTGECTVGVLCSYRKGQPWISEITVFKNGRTWDCRVDEGVPHGEITIVAGPEHDFRKPGTLDEATNSIKAYLENCVAHPTNEIGGHVHIGKFTPDGFSWIQPPK